MCGQIWTNDFRQWTRATLFSVGVISATTLAPAQADYSHYTTPYSFITYAGATSYGSADGAGVAARFYHPSGVAVDVVGNIYVADERNHTVRRIDPSGQVSTLAGASGIVGFVDGPADQARFSSPRGLAVDAAGNVFVADSGNSAVRRISPANVVSTVAREPAGSGNAPLGPSFDLFGSPQSVSVDAAGNVYAIVAGNFGSLMGFVTTRAVKIGPGGAVTTLYQSPVPRDPGAPWIPSSSFSSVVASPSGDVYITDMGLSCVVKISLAGSVSLLAGQSGVEGINDGVGTGATFAKPTGLAIDAAGNLWVADRHNGKSVVEWPEEGIESRNSLIRRISPDGAVTTLTGKPGNSGYRDGAASAALFTDIRGLAVDRGGNIYAAEWVNNVVRKITPAGEVSTLAGLAWPSARGNTDGPRETARFFSPQGMAFSANGDLFIADAVGHTLRKISASGQTTTLAGSPLTPGSDDGMGSAARFNLPLDVAVDAAGNVYVADAGNRTIRKVTSSGAVTTVAGSVSAGPPIYYESGDGVGSAARFNYPVGLTVDAAGTIYVADFNQNTIRRIDSSGRVTTLAGKPGFAGTADGVGEAARFNRPAALTLDAAGNLFVADYGSGTIRKVAPSGEVSTFAGTAGTGGGRDGPGSMAQFHSPGSLRFDSSGNLFVADSYNNLVRKITPNGEVSTIGGLIYAEGSADGAGPDARFFEPAGVAVDGQGNVFVSSLTAIRKGRLVVAPVITTQPQSQTVISGTNVTFTVVASGPAGLAYQWRINGTPITGATDPTLSLSGVRSSDSGDYTVVVSSATGSVTSTKATLTVTSATAPSQGGGTGGSGGGGGGAPSVWLLVSLGTMAALRMLSRNTQTSQLR